mgnify:CR=1 FL=1
MGFFSSLFGGGLSDVVRDAAKEAISNGARIIDVRTPAEYNAGHVENAINVPVKSISSRLGEIGSPSQPVVLYCRSGARSAMAKRTLVSSGYTSVFDIGSISNWPL